MLKSVAITICLICCGLVMPASASQSEPLVAGSSCGQYVDVQPLESTGNPYLGQYESWDSWIIANAVNPDSEALAQLELTGSPVGDEILRMFVTPEGFCVPLDLYYQALFMQQDSLTTANCPYFVAAIGVMPAAMRSELTQLLARFRAANMSPIPPWLATDPPQWALLLPDGQVATLGALGSGAGQRPYLPGAQPSDMGKSYYAYNADGSLRGKLEPGAEWWRLFFSGFDEMLESLNSQTVSYQEINGYIVVQDPANVSLFKVYDYQGNLVADPNQIFKLRNTGTWIDSGNISLVFEVQVCIKAE